MADPVVHITAGIPDSGTGNITTLGQTLLDGANLTMGVTTGAAVTTDATGTLQQYLRGLIKLFTTATFKAASTAPAAADPALVVAPSPNAIQMGAGATTATTQRFAIASDTVNANGQAAMAASAPVAIASDQAWPVSTVGFMKKEDVASADGDAGIPAMATRKAAPADTSGTDGDYEFLQIKDGLLWVGLGARAAGGLSSVSTIVATANGVLNVKNSPGSIKKLEVSNNSATPVWLKLHNITTTPVAGTSAVLRRILIPGNASGVLLVASYDYGIDFSVGIGYSVTGLVADADTTAVTANVLVVNIDYK